MPKKTKMKTKMKTRKALTKRFRITRKGKVMHAKAGKGHLQSGKSASRRRGLRKKTSLASGDAAKIKSAMK